MFSHRTLIAAAVALGLLEAVDMFSIDVPAAAALFAVLFLVSAAWFARRGGVGAPMLLVLLFAVEIAGLPFYARTTATDWIIQIGTGVVAAAGLVAAIAVLREWRRERRGNVQIA